MEPRCTCPYEKSGLGVVARASLIREISRVPNSLKRLGTVIRTERVKRRLSQEALASLAGISRTHVGEIERGAANPSFTTIEQIAESLGMSLVELAHEYERAGRIAPDKNSRPP
jgi:ribosome-binding protein aMBF1 (putative translation factor)